MVQIVHTRAAAILKEGQVYQNPRFLTAPSKDVKKAFVEPGHPHIVEAYTEAGIPVVIIGAEPQDERKKGRTAPTK